MDQGEKFTRLLVGIQPLLYGFILSLTHDRVAADDLMQETSAVMWRKFDQFQQGTNFGAWAMKIARFCVLEWRRQEARVPVFNGTPAISGNRLLIRSNKFLYSTLVAAAEPALPSPYSRIRSSSHITL